MRSNQRVIEGNKRKAALSQKNTFCFEGRLTSMDLHDRPALEGLFPECMCYDAHIAPMHSHIYSMKHESIHCGEAIRTVDDSFFLLSNCATDLMVTRTEMQIV